MAKKKKSSDDAAKGGSKKMILVGLAVLLVAGGAYETVLKPKKVGASPPPGSVAAMGPVVPEGQLTINLAGGHYLQVTPALQLAKGEKPTVLATGTAQISDLCITTFAGQDMATVSSPAGLAALKAKFVAGLDTLFPHTVTGVYFTQFVMQ